MPRTWLYALASVIVVTLISLTGIPRLAQATRPSSAMKTYRGIAGKGLMGDCLSVG